MKTPSRIAMQFLLGTAFFILICLLHSCKTPKDFDTTYNHIPVGQGNYYNKLDNFDSTQIIFWRKPLANNKNSKKGFTDFQKAFEKKYKPNHKFACGNCEGDLIIYQGDDIPEYYRDPSGVVGQTTGSSGSGSSGGSRTHGDDSIYWSVNFRMKFNDSSFNGGSIFELPKPVQTKEVKTVAVFDTGVDPDGIPQDYFYTNAQTSCIDPHANNGWNFVDNTSDWKDDHSERHGSTVTRFIIKEVNAYNQNSPVTGVKILPVKTHDSTGYGDLFGVLCAMAYAADRKADIVNASFGFYRKDTSGGIDYAVLFLKEYIEHYLTSKKILLIAAAGNGIGGFGQNLDTISFYPASLSSQLQNVIAVTTIDTIKQSVDPGQNYSNSVVNVGVQADVINQYGYYLFNSSRISGQLVRGTSYATPIVTGNLCAHYQFIRSMVQNQDFSRSQLLDLLNNQHLIRRNAGSRIQSLIAGNNAAWKKGMP